MATATKQSFVPAPVDEEVVPDLKEVVTAPGDRMKLAKLFAEHHSLGEEISCRKKTRDKLTKAIKDLLGKHKVAKCTYEDLSVNYFCVIRETLSKEDLLDHNVDPDIIEECTRKTPTYTLAIRKLKGEEEEE